MIMKYQMIVYLTSISLFIVSNVFLQWGKQEEISSIYINIIIKKIEGIACIKWLLFFK